MFDLTRRTYFGIFLGSIGIAFAVAGLTLWFVVARPHTAELNQAVLGIVIHVLFGYIVVMSGIFVFRSEFSVTQCFVATKWCLGGAVFMSLLVVWRAFPELRSGTVSLSLINELVIVSSVGAAAGVLVGINRGQMLRTRRLVSEKEDREETLVFLLRLLGHDIQNHVVAISNHAGAIRPSTFDPSPTPVEAIEERTANIERLLDTANMVLESETDSGEFTRVHLSGALREQLAVVRSDAPTVEIRTDIDDELYIDSDRFIGEVFRNLLHNAVVHNPTDELIITVSARETDGNVEVTIADNGSGVPADIRADLFEPGVQRHGSPGDGVGLYLVKKLVETYGGTISTSDRSPNGTQFRISFPKTAAENAS